MPVRQRSGRTVGRLESWTGVASVSWAFQPFDIPTFRPTTSSTSVFHAPHASQRPPHFGCSAPQSVQRNTERALPTTRSEEHTSELQSRLHLVCRLLLEKKHQRRCWLPATIRKD